MIDTGSWIVSTVVAIGAAKAGYGYWALVAMTVAQPLIATTAFWLFTAWVPGMPCRRAGIGSMVRFGGTLTVNGLLVYVASNFEKVLLGRFWGAEAIGIYGRAYQLIRIPTDTLNGAIGEVAFSALSRLQDDPVRLRSYFLKGYSLVLALTLPATFACGVFADDLIGALLGPKWKDAAPIFRLLTPTILVFRDSKSPGVAPRCDRHGRPRRKDVTGDRALHDRGLFYRIALWAKRSRIRLLSGDGALGRTRYCVVCTRHRTFFQGYPDRRGRPLASSVVAGAIALGVCSSVWSIPFGETHLGRNCTYRYVPWDAVVHVWARSRSTSTFFEL